MGGDDHDGVARLDAVPAAGDDDPAAPVDAADQQPLLQRQLLQGDARDLGAGPNMW